MQLSVHHSPQATASSPGDFEQQVLRLHKRVYQLAIRRLGNAADAEDIAQETFLRAWSHFDRYEPSRSVEAWVFRIAHNLCIDSVRRRRRRPECSLDTPTGRGADAEASRFEPADRSQDPEMLLMAEVINEGLQRSIQSLPRAYRACVDLLEHDLSYEEIARKLDCPLGTVRSRVHRAREYLRREMVNQAALA